MLFARSRDHITKNKKIVRERCVASALWPSALPGPFGQNVFLPCMPAAMLAHAGGGSAGGHRVRMLQAGASMAALAGMPWPLGHLGHLGHGFKLQAGASGRRPLGHLGHCFCIAQMTQRLAACARQAVKSLGHLGHFVIE